jgi:hypothetical protein
MDEKKCQFSEKVEIQDSRGSVTRITLDGNKALISVGSSRKNGDIETRI